MPVRRFAVLTGLLALVLLPAGLPAAEPELRMSIREHRFDPAELEVPAGERIRLIVENRDATPEEFESYDLDREKLIPGGGEAVIFIGPLEPGRYEVFGEFNPDTARGHIIAK